MNGEIAVGSYSPLSAYTQRNKVSTEPVPARHGRGGIVQRAEVEGERPISLDTGKQTKSDLFESGAIKKEKRKRVFKESSVDREEIKEDKETDSEVGGASHQELGGASHEVGGVWQVPVRRRENSKLRELMKAIESYDR